jgi:hypothetical protein
MEGEGMIITVKSFYMTCDAADCVDAIDEHADRKMLQLSAKNEGWIEHNGDWYCPDCAKELGFMGGKDGD